MFRNFDPPLNPAHISLYSASLVGLAAILLGVRAERRIANGYVANTGLRIALVGGGAEVLSGLLNEIYHQVIIDFFNSNILHFVIHGLFVVSMFVVALGGLVASSSLLAVAGKGSLVKSSLIFVSSIWLLSIGSVSYVTAFAGDAAGYLYILTGSFVAAGIAASTLPVINRFGTIILASALFFAVNGGLIYLFTRSLLLLPFSIAAALAVELVWRRSRNLSFNRTPLVGASTGIFSYWLLYPYSFTFFGFGILPGPEVITAIMGAIVTGALGAAFGSRLREYLSDFVRSAIIEKQHPEQR